MRDALTWPRAIVMLLGLVLLAPLAFERLSAPDRHNVEVRFLDSVDFTLLRHAYPDADKMNALVLAAGCGLALMAALLAFSGVVEGRQRTFFVVTTLLFAALTIEESFELTEAAAEIVGVSPRKTDLLVPLVGVAFAARYWRLFVGSRRAIAIGAAGVAVFGLAISLDTFTDPGPTEDPLESVASLLFLTAFAVLTLDLLTDSRAKEVTA
jgi:hypothetical protein